MKNEIGVGSVDPTPFSRTRRPGRAGQDRLL